MSLENRAAVLTLAIVAGLAQVATGVALYVTGSYFAPWSGMVSLGVLLVCIVVAMRWYRDNRRAGQVTYLQAFGIGIATVLGTAVVYAIYNVITIEWIYPHFLDDMARARAALGAQRGQVGQSVDTVRAQLSAPRVAMSNILFLGLRGVILAALAAIFVRRRSRPRPVAPASFPAQAR